MKTLTLSLLLIGMVIITVLCYAGALIYFTWPVSELSISSSGVFGDSFGALTSLFSGLAFAGLIITIHMQREELALQRQELKLTREELGGQKKEMQAQNETLMVQKFENTFFKMLELFELCRKDITYQDDDHNFQGRDAIKAVYELLSSYYLNGYVFINDDGIKRHQKRESQTREGLSQNYNDFYERFGDELGQYYMTLYHILKLVDRTESIKDKSVYTNLVRAQLSRYELLLLFYNCASSFGTDKMAPLVKKYNILKHIENKLLLEVHQNIHDYF